MRSCMQTFHVSLWKRTPEAAEAWWERHEEKQSQRASMFAFGFESAMICALCHMLSWIKQLAWNRYTVSI